MKRIFGALAVVLFALSFNAFADCEKEGKKYKTGDKVGPFTCMPDGSWKR